MKPFGIAAQDLIDRSYSELILATDWQDRESCLIWEMEPEITMRASASASDLDLLEPLWGALQAHHASVLPSLGERTPPRSLAESWARRRERYERWLLDDRGSRIAGSMR